MKHIFTKNAPEPGFYSQAVLVDLEKCNLLFLAGQTGNIPGVPDEPVVSGGLYQQTFQALRNILAVVKAAGGNINSIVEIKVFLKDAEETGEAKHLARAEARKNFGAAYIDFFAGHMVSKETKNLPARTLVWVSEVPLEYPAEDTLVELTATAAIPKKIKF
ncbi:MAG: RidA family protein [Candidatus Parcubacteria bacterium]|nr:RidA family protein [Candidatus Parcubacteria bacterium]